MRSLFRFVLILGVLSIAACQPRALSFEAGPYLVLNSSGVRVVRIEASPKAYRLEYELPDGRFESSDIVRACGNVYEASLPAKAMRYRVLVGEKKTKWYALAPTAVDGVQRIVAYGDPRVGRGNPIARERVMEQIAAEKPSLVIASGDLVAWGNHEGLWQNLLEELAPLASRLPYVAAIGNHDTSDEHFFKRYFRAGVDKNYMSMPLGSGKIILLDSNEIQQRGNAQYVFLEKELASAHNAWPLIVVFHHPPFNFGRHSPRSDLIEAWVPLFQKYAVDLVILGHDHDYQRIGPFGGVLYIVTGGGGAPLARIPAHTDPRLKKFAEVNHYVVLDINKDGMTGTVKDEDGKVIDRFSISR